jgi:phospholipid-transporting ATPase
MRSFKADFGLRILPSLSDTSSAAPVKRTAVERQVNKQIFFLFLALIALSLASTIGSGIRSVRCISLFPFASSPCVLRLTADPRLGSQWVFSSKQWYLKGDVSGNKARQFIEGERLQPKVFL